MSADETTAVPFSTWTRYKPGGSEVAWNRPVASGVTVRFALVAMLSMTTLVPLVAPTLP